MKRSLRFSIVHLVLTTMLMFASTVVVAQEKKEKPAAKKSEAKVDPFQVPDGKPEVIVKYIESMTMKAQRVRTIDAFKKHQQAILKAADKLLAAKVDGKTETTAIRAKFMALSLLGRFGDAKAAKTLQSFATKLKSHKNKEIAELATTQLLTARVQGIRRLKPAERKALVEEIKTFLNSGELRQRAGIAMSAAQSLENAGSRELAATTYLSLAKRFAKAKDKRLQNYAPKMEGSARRVMLLGNTIDIKGTTVDGKPFKWSDYKGKVVLVDFWATWCGPCIAELPNVKRAYAQYHDKGFEVVGISLDTSKEKLQAFIKSRKLEWTNLFSHDAEKSGWDHPMATYYGVMGIPNVILVDQKGKVIALNARGRMLEMHLKKLLGPPADAPKDSKSSKKE